MFVLNFILIDIFLPYRRADVKFRYGLCSLKIFNAILRTVFSAAAQLPPSVGQTCFYDDVMQVIFTPSFLFY